MTILNEENRTVKFTVKARNSDARPFYWYLEGEGVSPECFVGNSINGISRVTDTATVTLVLKNDQSIANLKNFKLIVKDDNEHGVIVATSSLVIVNVTVPTTQSPSTYEITPDVLQFSKGESITFTFITEAVPDETVFFWSASLAGVVASDFTNEVLQGEVTLNNGQATVTLQLKANLDIPENSTLILMMKKESQQGEQVALSPTVTINVASFNMEADFLVIEYKFTDGQDLDTRTRMVVPQVSTYVGWDREITSSLNTIVKWGGDNMGTGTETVLIDIQQFKILFPTEPLLKIDCNTFWYDIIGIIPVSLQLTAFKGGAMVLDEYQWTNITAEATLIIEAIAKPVTLQTDDSESDGEPIGFVYYNVNDFTGGIIPNTTPLPTTTTTTTQSGGVS